MPCNGTGFELVSAPPVAEVIPAQTGICASIDTPEFRRLIDAHHDEAFSCVKSYSANSADIDAAIAAKENRNVDQN